MIVLENKLYTSDETASVIGVTSRTLYRYVKSGEISPETKTKSGTYRFIRDEIYKYLYPDNFKEVLEQVKMVEQESTSYSSSGNEALNTSSQTQAQSLNQHLPAQSSTKITQPNNLVGDTVDSAPLSSITEESPAPTVNNVAPTQPLTADSEELDLDKELQNLEKDLSGMNIPSGLNDPVVSLPDTPVASASSPASIVNTSQNVVSAPAQSSIPSPATVVTEESLNTIDGISEISPLDLNTNPTVGDPSVSSTEDPWNYYLGEGMGLLDIAKKLNDLSKETGRKYAATMYGGLSLHKDIDEFFTIHFYVETEDLNWWVEQLSLKPSDKEKANICLIPSSDTNIFKDAYKLRGLFVASDQKLIEDLMKHGEKELAKSLI